MVRERLVSVSRTLIEVTGFSSFSGYLGGSGSSFVPMDASAINSFEKPEKLENPERPENLVIPTRQSPSNWYIFV